MTKRPLSLALLVLTGLAACGDTSTDYPALMPTDQLLADPAIPGHAEIAASNPDQVAADLAAAGAGLNVSSAQVTAEQVLDEPALADRAAALRRRAAEMTDSTVACTPNQDGTLPKGC